MCVAICIVDFNPLRPRIKIKDGHMVFEAAQGKNISFKSNSGAIWVNDDDLVHLVQMAKASQSQLQTINSQANQLIVNDLRALESRVQEIERSQGSNADLNDLKTKMDGILGTNSNK